MIRIDTYHRIGPDKVSLPFQFVKDRGPRVPHRLLHGLRAPADDLPDSLPARMVSRAGLPAEWTVPGRIPRAHLTLSRTRRISRPRTRVW